MARGIPNVTEVKKTEVTSDVAPLTKAESVPSNWDIVPDNETDGSYIFTNVVSNRVMKGSISDFNLLLNPSKE